MSGIASGLWKAVKIGLAVKKLKPVKRIKMLIRLRKARKQLEDMKMLKGKKTLITNGVVFLLMMVRIVWPEADTSGLDEESIMTVVDKVDAAIVAVINLVNMGLRVVTTTPVWKKGDD